MSMQPPILGAPVRTRAQAAAGDLQLQMASTSMSPAASLATAAAAVAQLVAKKQKRKPGAGDDDALTMKKLLTGAGANYTNAVGQSQWQDGAAVQQPSTGVRSYFFYSSPNCVAHLNVTLIGDFACLRRLALLAHCCYFLTTERQGGNWVAMIRKGTILSSPVTSFMVDVRVGPFNIDD